MPQPHQCNSILHCALSCRILPDGFHRLPSPQPYSKGLNSFPLLLKPKRTGGRGSRPGSLSPSNEEGIPEQWEANKHLLVGAQHRFIMFCVPSLRNPGFICRRAGISQL